jgi:hypothetical protein
MSSQREQGAETSIAALRVIAEELKTGLKDLERVLSR